VISVDELIAHSNIVSGEDSDFLQAKIEAAEKHLEQATGRAFLTQTRTVHFDGFCRRLELPVSPVQSITSVKYLDRNGVEHTIDPADYTAAPLNSDDPAYLYPASGKSWPMADMVTVELVAGYGEASANVPAPLKEAVKQLAAHWYENREAVLVGVNAQAIPLGLFDLIEPYRRRVF
jgi:uncharacterized phiE125 gp8 family phage protein